VLIAKRDVTFEYNILICIEIKGVSIVWGVSNGKNKEKIAWSNQAITLGT
jgi:hypothetical protein